MSEPGPEADASLSEDEVRAYVEKLRTAPAQQLLVETLFTSLNAAQVKLGRNDARLFIDLSALMLDRLRDYLPDDLAGQAEQALGQLRLGQVQAEREVAARAEPEVNDLDRPPTGIASRTDADPAAAPAPPPPPSAAGAKLWVPGRDL